MQTTREVCRKFGVFLITLLMTAAPVHPRTDQRPVPGPTPSERLFIQYRRFPERYLRISEQSWKYDPRRHVAVHTFTLRNLATAPYYYIRVRFTWLNSTGRTLHSRVVEVSRGIAALGRKQIRVELKGVPDKATHATIRIESARIILY